MKELSLRLPLMPKSKLKLPLGSEVRRAEMVRDICFLIIGVPVDVFRPDGSVDPDRYKQDEFFRVFLEGERRGVVDAKGEAVMDGKTQKTEAIEIPKTGDAFGTDARYRELGRFQTVETPATWHVFQVVKQ